MTEHDALLRTVCHHPDDDTPRLIVADYLDEQHAGAQAAFIRAQIEAARLPDWEPFAVYCRHRKPEWFWGYPWVSTLPPIDGWNVEWVNPAFHRGFGASIRLRSLMAWEQYAHAYLDRVPLREFWLRAQVTLDDWRAFAASPWAARLRRIHLESNPTEPLRALCESPHTTGITDIELRQADRPGIPFIVMDLLDSPLGRGLRGLHFRMGYEALEDLIDALTSREWARFERLSLVRMGLTADLIQRWCDHGGGHGLVGLDLRGNEALGVDGFSALARGLTSSALTQLLLSEVRLTAECLEQLGRCPALATVRRLDLSQNPLRPKATQVLASLGIFAGLRALNLANCRLEDKGIRHITQAKFWPNLVELDLRNNPITVQGVRHLLLAEPPLDLTALMLDGTSLGVDSRGELRQKYGDAVLFDGIDTPRG